MSESNDTATPEVWKPVVGFEGRYEVSNRGRVKSLAKPNPKGWMYPEKILRPGNVKGYGQVTLRKDGVARQLKVHRLVLEAFVGPCPEGLLCRHLNDVPSDNDPGNLAWGTQQENADDRVRYQSMPRGERHPKAKLNADDVRDIRRRREAGEELKPIAARFGVSFSQVHAICTRQSWRHLD
jgi:hypothetical protein